MQHGTLLAVPCSAQQHIWCKGERRQLVNCVDSGSPGASSPSLPSSSEPSSASVSTSSASHTASSFIVKAACLMSNIRSSAACGECGGGEGKLGWVAAEPLITQPKQQFYRAKSQGHGQRSSWAASVLPNRCLHHYTARTNRLRPSDQAQQQPTEMPSNGSQAFTWLGFSCLPALQTSKSATSSTTPLFSLRSER